MEKEYKGWLEGTQSDTFAGLREYMLKVYNYMIVGLLITGTVAYFTAQSPEIIAFMFGTNFVYVVMFSPLGILLIFNTQKSANVKFVLFILLSVIYGLIFSSFFLMYTQTSIAKVFFITAATFLTMTLYGYTTKTDLSRMGAFLIMALVGIIIAIIVNLFLKSAMMDLVISAIGVLVFTGLTAWDTQKIKSTFKYLETQEQVKIGAIHGALSLYLNFIMIFMYLMRFMGARK